MSALVTITIDGRPVTAREGETVFAAAKRAGMPIPGLCSSDHLRPFGSCRLCVCEIDGRGHRANGLFPDAEAAVRRRGFDVGSSENARGGGRVRVVTDRTVSPMEI